LKQSLCNQQAPVSVQPLAGARKFARVVAI